MAKLTIEFHGKRVISCIVGLMCLAFCAIIVSAGFLHHDPLEFFKPDNVECIACQFANSSFIASDNDISFHIEFSRYVNPSPQTREVYSGDWVTCYRERAPPQLPTII